MTSDSSAPLQAECSIEVGEDISLRYRLTNTSSTRVHVFDSARMPYLLRESDGSLLVLYGVNPPDPSVNYTMIEVPLTQPLEPGQAIAGQVVLSPLFLRDHYQKQRTPTALHGAMKVHFRAAWGSTPIIAADRARMSITQVLAWQRLTTVAELEVTFP